MNQDELDDKTMIELEAVELAAPEVEVESLDLAIADLLAKLDDLESLTSCLQRLRDDGMFRYISKTRRSELFTELTTGSDVVRDLSRVVFNGLKKIKRIRIPDEIIDQLLSTRD